MALLWERGGLTGLYEKRMAGQNKDFWAMVSLLLSTLR